MDAFERALLSFGISFYIAIWVVSILVTICALAEIDQHWGLLIGLLSMPAAVLAIWLCLDREKKC